MSGEGENPDKLQALRDDLAAAATPAERIKALRLLANELQYSDPAAARPLLEELIAEADAAGETKVWAKATYILSHLLLEAGDLDGSARHAEFVLRHAEATGDREGRARALKLIGDVHRLRGEYQRAGECFEESLRISREIGFRIGEGTALDSLAVVFGEQGDSEKSLVYFREALEVNTKAGDWQGRAANLHNIGVSLARMGRWTEAAEYYHRAIALSEEHNFHDQLLNTRVGLASLSLSRSDYENAALTFQAIIAAEREAKRTGRVSWTVSA